MNRRQLRVWRITAQNPAIDVPPQMASGRHCHRIEGQCENGNVVFLAEIPSGLGDGLGGFTGDRTGTVEAEQFASGGFGFDHPVGDEGEGVAGGEREGGFDVGERRW